MSDVPAALTPPAPGAQCSLDAVGQVVLCNAEWRELCPEWGVGAALGAHPALGPLVGALVRPPHAGFAAPGPAPGLVWCGTWYGEARVELVDAAAVEREAAEVRREGLARVAGALAHDLNNLFTVLLSEADLIAEEAPADLLGAIRDLRAAAESGARMVRRLQALTGKSPRQPRPLSARALLEGTERLVRSQLPRAVRLDLTIDPGAPLVEADLDELVEALIAAVINARDALAGRAGRIALRADGARRDDLVWLRLSVADDGPGIAPDVAARAFDPFFTTRARGASTGLGLAALQASVRAHGGFVELGPALDGGTRCDLWLPALSVPATEAPELPAGPIATRRVLLVDDNAAVLRAVARMLERLGAEVVAHADPREALRAFERAEARFDAALLDVDMPHIRGTVLAGHLRKRRPEQRVVLMTGDPGRIEPSARDLPVIAKPMTLAGLRSALS